MAAKTYILCPGQGAQTVGMGLDLFQSSPAAKAVFEQANALAGFDLASACFTGPRERLDQTDVSQPGLYVVGVASFRAAVESGVFDAKAITAYAGLSLGEYTALHLAGAFSFEEGFRLVSRRGKLMQQAAVAKPSGMVAIVGAEAAAVENICEQARGDQVLVAANFNAPGQIVISGDKDACARAVAVAGAAGLRAVPLAVAGAFHSPLMQSAADAMREELSRAAIAVPAVPVYSNVTAQPHGDVQSIRQLLVEQIVKPVRWEQTMMTLFADAQANSEMRVLELSPGRTLAGLAKRVNRRLPLEENAGWKKAERVLQ